MRKSKVKSRRTNNRKNKKNLIVFLLVVFIVAAVAITYTIIKKSDTQSTSGDVGEKGVLNDIYKWPDFEADLLDVNPYSRSGEKVGKINNIVIHYTANPGSTAKENRDYFESLSTTHTTYASSHFVIGIKGEAIQCIPLSEISYASNNRNNDTISIENCHPDASGKFSEATYKKLVEMCAWLCLRYNLSSEDVIRHYDVTGKICPKYFVEHEDSFVRFKEDVKEKMENYPLMENSK